MLGLCFRAQIASEPVRLVCAQYPVSRAASITGPLPGAASRYEDGLMVVASPGQWVAHRTGTPIGQLLRIQARYTVLVVR